MIKNTSNKKYNTQRINTQTLIDISNNNINNNKNKDRYKDKDIHKDGGSLELRKTKYIQINKT